MIQAIAVRQRVTVMNVNVHAINLAQRDARFKAALNAADVVFCDGQGVRLGAWLLGCSIPERFTPPDWIREFAAECAHRGYRIFLLGARAETAQGAADQLRSWFPELQVASHHGYFDPLSDDNAEIVRLINHYAPHVLLVGMGMPRQELWLQDNLGRLSVNVAMPVGALFDYLAGRVQRGPRWLTDHGFEWLCRLWFEPRRLWRRYLLGNPVFVWRVLRDWLRF
jgi:N-acetylglucosaminyldiphosphoundecaprenol N-acetyl-beta-D-mannosaminyltransferase